MDVPYRAVDKFGNTIDFYLSSTRNAKAAERFLGKALNGLKDWEKPTVINTDKAPTYGIAISELKAEGKCPGELVHRQIKYLSNVVEADHGKLKQLIRSVRGFKTLKAAYATIKGFEGSSSICLEIGQFDWHHPRPEKLWSRPAVHCALDRLQSVDLAFCLTVAPGQVDGVTDGVDITA